MERKPKETWKKWKTTIQLDLARMNGKDSTRELKDSMKLHSGGGIKAGRDHSKFIISREKLLPVGQHTVS